MVVEYELAGAELGDVRFAISPMNELAFSLRAWRDPGRFPLHLPWLRQTAATRRVLDADLLLALTNEDLWLPDFLTPRPRSPLTRFADEIAALSRTSVEDVREGVNKIHPRAHDAPKVLRIPPDRLLTRIVDAVSDYWTTCFEPWWPRMRSVLEADVVHRGWKIAREGLAAMFADLSPRIRLVDDLVIAQLVSDAHYRRSTVGEGLTLTPSLFTRHVSAPISAEVAPLLIYPSRGVGTVWNPGSLPTAAALERVVGAVRGRLLRLLDTPASATQLAVRLGVTTSAVNQQLRALHAAGLLTSARHGRSVLYLRSDLGDALTVGGGAATLRTKKGRE